jgi:Ca2+-transporting ATPase
VSVPARKQNSKPPYQQPVEAVIASLGADARRGLSEAEARARLDRDGRNELTAENQSRAGENFSRNSRTFSSFCCLSQRRFPPGSG